MTLSDLAFLVGPVAGPFVVAGSCATVVALTRHPRAVVPTAGLSCVVMASFVTYWYFWGRAFDAADALQAAPSGDERAMNVAMALCAAAATTLVCLSLGVAGSHRRRPREVAAPGAG